MTKEECEQAIRYLCHEWAKLHGIPDLPVVSPSFPEFQSWLHQNGYSHYLNFRSVAGPQYDAEVWFDDEFGLTGMR